MGFLFEKDMGYLMCFLRVKIVGLVFLVGGLVLKGFIMGFIVGVF